jgi:short-subunit dehydrogenase
MSNINISAKTILITGATSGIGSALFSQYVANGDKVIACGRNKAKLSAISSLAHLTCAFDVNNTEQVKQEAEHVGDIDVLILNAGDCRYINNVKQFDGELFSDVISTNLSSLGTLLSCFLPKMKRGGQVVFISSSATILPFPRSEAYGASKAGMDYLANSLRLDLVGEGIDVILVHPGFVKTALTDKNNFDMPFIITSDDAAHRIMKGVTQRKKYLHFPKRLTYLLKAFSFLPSSVWQKIILRNES